MTPFCESCGAHTLAFDDRPAEPHRATCPWGDEMFVRRAAAFFAGVDVRVSQFEGVSS